MRFSDYESKIRFTGFGALSRYGMSSLILKSLMVALILFFVSIASDADGQTSLPSSTSRPHVKTISTRLAGFGVPFKVDPEDQSYIEVHLYVSADQGKTWQFYDRKQTDADEFPFQSKGDGEYWFALRTLSRDRKLLPEGKIGPELKIVVDTVKPKLDFRIETDPAGRVVCRWRAEDPNINPRSLRIQYREDRTQFGDDDDERGWQHVPIDLNRDVAAGVFSDQLAWWPDTAARSLVVRISLSLIHI